MKLSKIKKNSLMCFVLLLPFFEPQFFKTISIINSIYNLLTYAVLIYVIIRILFMKKKFSYNMIIIVVLEGWMLLITYIKSENTSKALSFFVILVGIASVVYLYSNKIETLIKCLLLHFEICVYINLLTVYLLKNGLYLIETKAYDESAIGYFLGWHHLFLVWEIPALLIAWLYREMYHTNKRCYLLSIAIFLTEIYFGGSTGIVGVTLIIILCSIPAIKKIITPYKGMFFAIAILILIVFVRSYGFLEPIIVSILNKDMTFTGRLGIWNYAIKAIISHPIIGHGILEQNTITSILGLRFATHCHNQMLQVLFQGGVVGFALFISLYVVGLNRCRQLWKYRTAQVCVYVIITYTIIGITEVFEYALMYLVLIIPLHLKELCVIENRNKQLK